MAAWRRAMSAYDTDCGASVMAWMRPVSCTGKKPLGMNTYSSMVTHQRGDRHHERQRLALEHPLERHRRSGR